MFIRKAMSLKAMLLVLAMVISMLTACAEAPAEEPPQPADTTPIQTEPAQPEQTQPVLTEPEPESSVPVWTEPVWSADLQIALITSGDEALYGACKEWCEAHSAACGAYAYAEDSTAARVAAIESAAADGSDMILLPGYAFGEAIWETAELFPDVKFIGLDVSERDLGDGYVLPDNVTCITYREEQMGFLTGYAAVRMGYEHLAFLGGMAVPELVRLGHGFVQGADAAAKELEKTDVVTVDYVYHNTFCDDATLAAAVDALLEQGAELTFVCADEALEPAARAAACLGSRIITVDGAQLPEGERLTSAVKRFDNAARMVLDAIEDDRWSEYGGQYHCLGVAANAEGIPFADSSFVGLAEDTQYADGFSLMDYQELVVWLFKGFYVVSDDLDTFPETAIAVNDQGSF